MLAQRIVTALVLITLFGGAVLVLSNKTLAVVLAVTVMLGAWEWTGFSGVRNPRLKISYVLLTAIVMIGIYRFSAITNVLVVAAFWWCVALVWIAVAQRCGVRSFIPSPIITALLGWLVLVPAWAALVELHRHTDAGPVIVLILMILIWCADIAAFFVGRQWGRTRLAVKISPAKTWEGALGGIVASAALALVATALVDIGVSTVVFLCLALTTVSFSILGDLFESLLKRAAGLKDSGTLLPGHGGVLDRVDSLTAAAPIFALGLLSLRVTV